MLLGDANKLVTPGSIDSFNIYLHEAGQFWPG
jgi:hypothetical protein